MPPELRGSDVALVREQLGREPTTTFEVTARCPDGHPLVIRNYPRDAAGEPFPTTFWLTCPEAVKAVSRIEAGGAIARLNARFDEDPVFRAEVERAHAVAAEERARMLPEARAWGGVGGTRTGLKCLHAHYANHLGGGEDAVGAWVAAEVEPIHPGPERERIAVVDQGTHTCRLLVVERGEDGEPAPLAEDMIITRLGEGVDATGMLDPGALARTEVVLARYCRRARALGATRIRVAATSAVRDAANRELFVEMVRRHAGTDPEVIGGDEEARLSFLGGTRGLPAADGPFLLLDIGGGSTEFVVGTEPGRAAQDISLQIGSVRITERHVGTDPPAPAEMAAVRATVATALDAAEVAVPAIHTARTMVSVAGTATTIQAVALGLGRYDPEITHRSRLSLATAAAVLERLAAMTTPERAALPVMAPGRAEVIVAGGLILVETMRRFGFDDTLVSETDILLGLALDTLGVG